MVFRIMTGELPTLGQATCCPAFYPCDPGSEGSCEVGGAQLREQNLWYGNIPFRGSEVLDARNDTWALTHPCIPQLCVAMSTFLKQEGVYCNSGIYTNTQ